MSFTLNNQPDLTREFTLGSNFAKRLECAQLAAAFTATEPFKNRQQTGQAGQPWRTPNRAERRLYPAEAFAAR